MAINSVTDLRNTDPGQTAFTVRQNPVGGQTPCHAVQVSQAATSGGGAGINVVSDNTQAPAYRAKAAGPMIRLYNASNVLVFEVDNTGTLTTGQIDFSGTALSALSLSTTGDAEIGGALDVTGGTEITGALNVGGYVTLAGGQTNGNWAVFGEFSALGNKIGFYGATTVAKQTVSGSRGGNEALASLMTALANLGLFTDGTSA